MVSRESEATGFSPGAEPVVWPDALSAPRPCSTFEPDVLVTTLPVIIDRK